MSLMWRDPLEMATPLRDVMSRLLEQSFIWPEHLGVSVTCACSIDLHELEDQQQYILEANVAGFKPEEIQITSSEDTVTIHAARKEEARTEKAGYGCRERYAGEISRTVTLPAHINADEIQATCEQGSSPSRFPKRWRPNPSRFRSQRKDRDAAQHRKGRSHQRATPLSFLASVQEADSESKATVNDTACSSLPQG